MPILAQPKSVTSGSRRVYQRLRSHAPAVCKVLSKRSWVRNQVVPRLSGEGSVAKAKQGGAMLLESDAAKWLGQDVRRVVLALDVLELDGAVQLANLELATVDVLRLGVAHRVVGEVHCAGVVHAQLSQTWRQKGQLCQLCRPRR
eukprot:6214332-Pleurochrysis_carterae.AAC.3